MNFVLVRHGRILTSGQQKYIGSTDIGLSPEGAEDIERLKSYIKDTYFDAVYSSPLLRAVQSTNLLTDKYIVDKRLKETDFGIFEGKTYKEIKLQFPAECKKWINDYTNYTIPKGESLNCVFNRVESFLRDIGKRSGNILIITHEGIIRCALSLAVGNRNCFFRFRVGCGRFAVLSVDKGYMYIKAVNGLFNLNEVL